MGSNGLLLTTNLAQIRVILFFGGQNTYKMGHFDKFFSLDKLNRGDISPVFFDGPQKICQNYLHKISQCGVQSKVQHFKHR
jgi:hypothetical protein